MISSFCFSLRRPCGNLKFANGIVILLLVFVLGMCGTEAFWLRNASAAAVLPPIQLWPATARARAASAPKPLDAPVMTIILLTKLPPLLTCDVWGLRMLLAGQPLGG